MKLLRNNDADAAVPVYPRGLEQAACARFSLDALLLAAFAPAARRVVDLGTGCGVAALGMLLRGTAGSALGLDSDAEQIAAARRNARRLGLSAAFSAQALDLADLRPYPPEDRVDLVISNPPWRRRGAERLPASPRRQRALYGDEQTFSLFCRAAAGCLERGGTMSVVTGAERLADMLAAMAEAGISPSRILAVHPRPGRLARFALIEGRYAVSARLTLPPPLFLHDGISHSYTAQAQDFCSWLGA